MPTLPHYLITTVILTFLVVAPARSGEYPNDRWKEHRTAIGTCLINHADNGTLDQILTEAMAMEVKGGTEKPEADYVNSKYVPKGYQSIVYSWGGTRTKDMTVMGKTITINITDDISFGSVRQMNPEYFDNSYRTPTEEDKQRMREQMAKALDTSAAAATETHKKAGSALVENMMDGMAYESVDGIGDDAAWDIKESKLIVLTGDVVFDVKVDLEFDWRSNMKRAIPLARKILAACQ